MAKTFGKPTLKGYPATGEVTINLSKIGEALTVQIPDADISPNSSVQLSMGIASKPPEWTGSFESMMVKKTPETHPDDFEIAELRKGVTLIVPSDALKKFSGKSVELRYTFTYESGGADTSEPQKMRIKA